MILRASIRKKLAFTISTTVGLILTAIIVYIAVVNRQMAVENAEKEMTFLAEEYALKVEREIDKGFHAARAMVTTFKSFKQGSILKIDRSDANALLKQVLIDNPSFAAAGTLWEPNAFDNKDAFYVNKKGHDATGRLIPYWSRGANNELAVEPLFSYDEEGTGDYYLIPKRTGRETMTEPYIYPIQGQNVMVSSIVAPITIDGAFKGMAGIDITVNFLQQLAEDAKSKLFEGQVEIAIITNQGLIAAYTKDANWLGKNIKEVEEGERYKLSLLETEEVFFDKKDDRLEVNLPIHLGATGKRWLFNISMPESVIFAEANQQMSVMIGIGILSLCVMVMVAFFIAKTFTRPIYKVVDALDRMSQKQINFKIDENRHDEIGDLYISINKMNHVFSEMIQKIDQTATAVLHASSQLSTISGDLSDSSTEQAASAEQISVSMHQILTNINTNTQTAEKTSTLATQSAKQIKESNQSFAETVKAVSAISKETSIITEIARKTNMLSLNASVEAARAGEEGKGFSIVAEEIRKLAANAQVASEKINELSENGKNVSKTAGDKLNNTVPEILKSSELVSNIVRANHSQKGEIQAVNSAMQQLSDIVSRNSASAEEMSESAKSLLVEAQHLKDLINTSMSDIFTMNENDIAVK